jgi:acyl-ACP thioesterase
VVLSDLDIVNHVNNIKYIEWCLDCLPAEVVLSASIIFMEMHFLREMVWNDSVQIDEENQTFYVTKNDKNCFILSVK